MTPESINLLLLSVAAVAVLIILIAWLRMNAFLALLMAGLVIGLGSGMGPAKAMTSFQDGMGATLGGIAGVLGLGTILGGLLAASGGAEVLAKALIRLFGPKRVHWCLMVLALCIGLTTWFAVGLVMLVPILVTLARETKEPFLKLAIPMLAVLSIMHGVMPPHPGPVVALDALGADLGKVLLWGLLAAVPVAAVSGPIFARWAVRHVNVETPEPPPVDPSVAGREKPSLAITSAALALPILLLLSQTVAELFFAKGHPVRNFTSVIGNPTLALGISVIFAGVAFRFSRTEALKIGEKAIAAVGMTLLVVGGGGGFNRVLRDCGAADAIGQMASAAHLPPLVFGWVCAALVRVATGSATVAITAASGLVAPLVIGNPDVNPELVVVGIGCGSLFLSHLNDAGFWIVKETLGMTVGQTLRTWTVTETLVGITGLFVAWGLDMVF
ncbi:GntP family gluconate:H+ symporter [Prosthecobacter fusiformis]|uniref:GntP family gluconate:H+ symporter n=1 Tax=Prosthecobacter fusiformis TaxID=48464 RepID=A0A4V3FI54_9BACT|nr:gluconate:H+ symporter [Prosthecobacter fusiformis]TDU81113.1 GntP family gluconate:H+ symporter [Prosthecobacter fusiformis]